MFLHLSKYYSNSGKSKLGPYTDQACAKDLYENSPQKTFSHFLNSLDLSYNNLESVSHVLLNDQFPHLEILKLNNNLLKQIHPAATFPPGLKEL